MIANTTEYQKAVNTGDDSYGAQAEADRLTVGSETPFAGVHVRRQDGYSHIAALVDVLHDFGRIAGFRGSAEARALRPCVAHLPHYIG